MQFWQQRLRKRLWRPQESGQRPAAGTVFFSRIVLLISREENSMFTPLLGILRDAVLTIILRRQKNMDYCLCQVALYLTGIYILLVLYDIWCHYFVNLLRRMEASPGLSLPDNLKIVGGIGQFHVHGHRRECYPRFSPNFIPGAGILLGEVIETLWPDTNRLSDSTRGMSDGHRQEVLDDTMNDSNWNKLTRLGM